MERVALVTGENTGIGLAIARRLLAQAHALAYATAGDDHERRGPLAELRRQGTIAHVFGDLMDPEVPGRLVAETLDQFGRIDVLVNNAGISLAKPFFDLDVDDFDATFGIDVRAAFLLSQAAARHMRESGGGCIVNITSVHEHVPRVNLALDAAAKAALGMLTRGLALGLAPFGIRVNAIAPGVIATPAEPEGRRGARLRGPARPAGPARGGGRARGLALHGRGCLRHGLELRHGRRDDPAGRRQTGLAS